VVRRGEMEEAGVSLWKLFEWEAGFFKLATQA